MNFIFLARGKEMFQHSRLAGLSIVVLVTVLIFFGIASVSANDDLSLFISKYGIPCILQLRPGRQGLSSFL